MTRKRKKSFLLSPEWKALRVKALERDGHKCCLCGSSERLNVHHLLYRRHYGDLKLDIDNLLTVCSKCHFNIHKSSGNFNVLLYLIQNRPELYEYIIAQLGIGR